MSVDSSVKEEKLGVQIQVSSKKIQSLLEKGMSPSEVLSEVIEKLSDEVIQNICSKGKEVLKFDRNLHWDPEEAINAQFKSAEDIQNERFQAIQKLTEKGISRPEALKQIWPEQYYAMERRKKENAFAPKTKGGAKKCPECSILTNKKNHFLEGYNRCYVCEAWRGRFKRYIDFLVNKSEEESPQNPEDYDDYSKWDHVWYSSLVSLLIAYFESRTNSPNGPDLLEQRLHKEYVKNLKKMYSDEIFEKIWQEELRTAKTRLTIEAKHRGFDAGPFRPPYGNKEKRKHPMFPSIYKQLREYFNPSEMPRYPKWDDEKYGVELGKLKNKRNLIREKYRHVPLDQRRLFNYDD